jgi:hypothetical protein
VPFEAKSWKNKKLRRIISYDMHSLLPVAQRDERLRKLAIMDVLAKG